MWGWLIYGALFTLLTYVLRQLLSEKPNYIKFQSKFFLFYFLSSCLAVVVLPFFALNPKNVKNSLYAAQILKHITKLIEVKWELRDGRILSQDRGAVIVANHQSTLDILGMFNIWHAMDKVASIARKEVFYVWPFGLAAYLAGVVFIDRNNPKDSYKQLQVTSDVMINNKTKIWLFAEGTRNKKLTTLLPFKRGAFKVAVAAQVPILPVVISPYYFINGKKYIFNKGRVIVQCLEPIPTAGLTMDDVPALSDRVHDVMERKYKELSKEVLAKLPSDYPLVED